MVNTIYKSVRMYLGLEEDEKDFEEEILMYINSAIGALEQNGVVFLDNTISKDTTWDSIDSKYLDYVKEYIYLKTKMLFDPPSVAMCELYKESMRETLWRIKEI